MDEVVSVAEAYSHGDSDAILGLIGRRKAIPLATGTARLSEGQLANPTFLPAVCAGVEIPHDLSATNNQLLMIQESAK